MTDRLSADPACGQAIGVVLDVEKDEGIWVRYSGTLIDAGNQPPGDPRRPVLHSISAVDDHGVVWHIGATERVVLEERFVKAYFKWRSRNA